MVLQLRNKLFADEPTGSRDNNFHVIRLRSKLRNNDWH
jgi:hypothetical protein